MATNLAALRIMGDVPSAVWVAPLGTTLPVGLAAPAAGFKELGWLSEDGVKLDRSVDVAKFKAHQGGTQVKTKITGTETSFAFQALEENATVLGLMHAGATGVTTTGVSTITIPGGVKSDPRAWVIDEFESGAGPAGAALQTRYVFSSGTVTDRGSIVMKTDELVVYEFTVDVTGDFVMSTNSPSVVYPIP